jgi:hypothetical protein
MFCILFNNADASKSQYCDAGYGLPASGVSALLVHGEDDPNRAADVQTKLQSTGAFLSVDAFSAFSSTPTLPLLQQYTVVFVFRYGGFQSTAGLGDVLAQYWDGGGAVVLAWNAVITLNAGIFGISSNGYILLETTGYDDQNYNTLGTLVEPQSPLLIGVTSLSSSFYRSTGAVINDGTVVARWNSPSYPLVVKKSRGGRSLVTLNMWPPSSDVYSNSWSGDGAALMRNALLYATCKKVASGDDIWDDNEAVCLLAVERLYV